MVSENLNQEMAAELRNIIVQKEKAHERRMQGGIGPSELGNPCDRYLAYKALGVKPPESDKSSWLATLGTAGHGWLEKAFEAENKRLGRERYVTEVRVQITGSIYGTVDLYDWDTGTVIDHKILGNTSYHEIKMGRIPRKYRVQLHSYGKGIAKEGAPVNQVALAAYSRTDDLDGSFSGKPLLVWTEPYDEEIANQALSRYGRVTRQAEDLGEILNMQSIEVSEDVSCMFCPFLKPGHGPADEKGCPGKSYGKPADKHSFLDIK